MKRGVLLFGNAVVSIVRIGFVLHGCLCTQRQEYNINPVTSGKAVATSWDILNLHSRDRENMLCSKASNVQMNSIVYYDSELC